MSDQPDEREEQVEDLELAEDEAANVKGGARKLPDTGSVPPATPPGVPTPYPNT
jgi:hypothetical protein